MLKSSCKNFADNLPSNNFILFVGALSINKGIKVLLDAYRDLPDVPPLVIIGAEWADSVNEFPQNVFVFKNWPHDAVVYAWTRCQIGIVPSIWPEPCPTVILEAMAARLPVVAYNVGGVSEAVIHGLTGFLIPFGDMSGIVQRLHKLIGDQEQRYRMGDAGYRRIKENFTIEKTADAVREVINQVLKDRSSV